MVEAELVARGRLVALVGLACGPLLLSRTQAAEALVALSGALGDDADAVPRTPAEEPLAAQAVALGDDAANDGPVATPAPDGTKPDVERARSVAVAPQAGDMLCLGAWRVEVVRVEDGWVHYEEGGATGEMPVPLWADHVLERLAAGAHAFRGERVLR